MTEPSSEGETPVGGTPPPKIPRDPDTDRVLRGADTDALIGTVATLKRSYDAALESWQQATAMPDLVGTEGGPGVANYAKAQAIAAAQAALGTAQNAYFNTLDEINSRGFDITGKPISRKQSADNAASIAAAYERTMIEQAGATERQRISEEGANKRAQMQEEGANARNERSVGAQERGKNIDATLELLRSRVASGELTAQQARDKAQAAFNAAQIERDVTEKFAPLALPAGSEYFPNLGPTGSIAAMAQAMGLPFSPVATGGTFSVNPKAMSAPITAAQAGPAVDLGPAMMNAAKALVGLGVPQSAVGV